MEATFVLPVHLEKAEQRLVHRPDEILPQVAGFLGVADKLPAMRACIDPALHRERKKGPPLKNN
jgi:hypothetical protein